MFRHIYHKSPEVSICNSNEAATGVMGLTGRYKLRYVLSQRHYWEGTMGLLRGTITATKYRVIGTVPDDFRNFVDERIKRFAFTGLSTGEAEKSIGWTSIDNILDTEFSFANYSIADYLIFSLRIDRKVVPPALLKLKVLEAEQELLAQRGADKIYKAEMTDLKDRVRLSLMSQTPPIPSTFEVCWNVSERWLVFGSLSEKVKEDFVDLFSRTFNLSLRPFLPWDIKYVDSLTAGRIDSVFDGTPPGDQPHEGNFQQGRFPIIRFVQIGNLTGREGKAGPYPESYGLIARGEGITHGCFFMGKINSSFLFSAPAVADQTFQSILIISYC